MSWQDYREEIDRKRAYWQDYNRANPMQQVLFLETSITDLRGGREAFEKRPSLLLSRAGVKVERRSAEELQEAVVTHQIGHFSTMCLQYIQKAKKQGLSPQAMGQKIAEASGLGIKTTAFLHIANNIYHRYQQALADENKIDFDDLLNAAIDRVHETRGAGQVRIANGRFVAMNDVSWIMIDEYQDFSRLFFDLIAAIRTYNEQLNLFCVGDDWQAINAFAGSDVRFFDGFSALIEGAKTGYLQSNYRSEREIVELGNRFMQGKGKPSIPTVKSNNGRIELHHTDKVWIELRPNAEFAEDRALDERFKIAGEGGRQQKNVGMRLARMLKQCHAIVTSPIYTPDSKFAILSRVDHLGAAFRSLSAFRSALKSTLLPDELMALGDFDARVRCGTVHSFKGLEADAVIVLGVNERNFPKIHPDNELYAIFGGTAGDVLAEEVRLFYVALTRTKADLYLLTETDKESEFLSRLGLLPVMRSEVYDDIPF